MYPGSIPGVASRLLRPAMATSPAIEQSVYGVILAGGLARRLDGVDKAAITVAGRPLVDHVIERFAPQVRAFALNTNRQPPPYAPGAQAILPDPVKGHPGPLAGVLAGMRWAQTRQPSSWIVSVAVDTPFMPTDLVRRLVNGQQQNGAAIVLASSNGRRHPVIGLFSTALADDLEQAIRLEGLRKVMHWVGRHRNSAVAFTPGSDDPLALDPFFNVNTPADLQQAEAHMRYLATSPSHGAGEA